jgi:cyanophycin synthetase
VLVERIAARVLRTVATASGTTRLGVRARPGETTDEVVLAYPWRHRGRAEVLGECVAAVLGCLDRGEDVPAALDAAVERVLGSPLGRTSDLPSPRIPVVSVTGTNGKTTVTRLLAHLAMTDGYRTGWTNTDGIYLQGKLIEPGDWSGPGGARRVLDQPGVELAVLETARGGLLLRGMGVDHNDVSVVTNVSDDHLGMQGIDTLDQLAEVKSVIVGVTRATGWTVLNGDDPRTLAMRARSRARPWVFSLDPASPALRAALDAGGHGATVLDGDLAVITQPSDPDHLVPLADVPLTLAGLSRHNVANALAGMAGGLAVGLRRDAVVAGLRSFTPDPVLNPGRLNLYSLDGVTVVVDLAHNEAGLEALLDVLAGLRGPGAAVRLVLGTAGDRQDSVLQTLGELAARGADDIVIGHKERYLRGRTTGQMGELYRQGAAAVGVGGLGEEPTELAALQVLVGRAAPGDVVGVMCHAERAEIDAWLRGRGATPDDPAQVRAKVLAARP